MDTPPAAIGIQIPIQHTPQDSRSGSLDSGGLIYPATTSRHPERVDNPRDMEQAGGITGEMCRDILGKLPLHLF